MEGQPAQTAMTAAELAAFLVAEFPQAAAEMAVEAVTAEGADLRLCAGPQHLRPGGTVSGPAMFALADVAFYLALLSRIGPVARAVTTNGAIDFLRKPPAGRDLIGRARLLKVGRRLAQGDVLVFAEGLPGPVARASFTYAIPAEAPPADGVS